MERCDSVTSRAVDHCKRTLIAADERSHPIDGRKAIDPGPLSSRLFLGAVKLWDLEFPKSDLSVKRWNSNATTLISESLVRVRVKSDSLLLAITAGWFELGTARPE